MLDTSEQYLNSSYRDTQDSDTEDDSSTNGSANEQNSSLVVIRIQKIVTLL